MRVKINMLDLFQVKMRVGPLPENLPQGLGDIFWLQLGGPNLIQQREEIVVIVLVDQGNIHRSLRQRAGSP